MQRLCVLFGQFFLAFGQLLVDQVTAQNLVDLFIEAGSPNLGGGGGLIQPGVDALGDPADVSIAGAGQVVQAFDGLDDDFLALGQLQQRLEFGALQCR
jgi:hypothetical protein